MARWVVATAALLIAACGSNQPTIISLHSPTASAARSQPTAAQASPTPTQPDAAMQVAIDDLTQKVNATYLANGADPATSCPASARQCLSIVREVDGSNAAYFRGLLGNKSGDLVCAIYSVQDVAGWRFGSFFCAEPKPDLSWPGAYVFNTGRSCANVRANPGLTGKVVGCLKDGTTVTIDGGPNYVVELAPAVSHAWWHLEGQGWIATDFLVVP